MYPGGTYLVTIRALMSNGDFGPGKTIEATTNSHEQLGSVVAASAKEPYDFYAGFVQLQWQGAAGHPRFLYPSEGITVTIEWKKAGESYSPERMQEVQPNYGFQVIPRALYWGQPENMVQIGGDTGDRYDLHIPPDPEASQTSEMACRWRSHTGRNPRKRPPDTTYHEVGKLPPENDAVINGVENRNQRRDPGTLKSTNTPQPPGHVSSPTLKCAKTPEWN